MKRDVFATALNAMSNASRTPVSEADIISILTTGDGPGNLVRALFSDCSLETLDRLGDRIGLSRARVLDSYAIARQRHAAANSDIEET